MTKNFFDNIKRFKLRSVFFRFYILIFSLTILLIGFFSAYIYRVYIQNFAGSQKVAQESFLTQTIEKLDNSISFMNETVVALSQNIQIVESVVIPSLQNQERNFETAQLLMTNADNFNYFNEIYLYEDTQKILYTSNGVVNLLESTMYQPFIESCLLGEDCVLLESMGNKYDSSIAFKNDKIFLVCRFIAGNQKYLGVLVAEINQKELFSGLEDVIKAPQYGLEIQNGDGKTLFFADRQEHVLGDEYREQVSGYTGWRYLLSVPSHADFTIGTYFKTVFPFLLFLLAAGFLFSLIIARKVYSPIHQLLFSIRTGSEEEGMLDSREKAIQKPANEVEVLATTYKQLQSDQKAAEAFMAQARPELEANLLLDLITDNKEAKEDFLEKQIEVMHSSLCVHGRYQSFIIWLSQAGEPESLIYYMAFRQIQKHLKEIFQEEWGWIYFLRPEGNHNVCVVQYRAEFSAAKIKQVHRLMMSELKKNLDSVGSDILLVHGKVYQELSNISMSYHEAKEELRKLCYYEEEGEEEPKDTQKHSVHDSYFASQLQQLQAFLRNGDVVLAENLLTQFFKELCVNESEVEHIRSWYIRILDILVEKTLDVRAEGNTLGNPQYQLLYKQLEQCTDQKSMYLFMVKETSKILEILKKEINKRQHKLISGAKDYMKQHYSDSSLSIHQIAESIGISDTYLSSIFTEFTGENLVTYLNSYRVSIAKDLLVNTRIIIKDIGFKTGFNTVQNFNRVFKRCTGMTPGDYRKQYKADDGE